MNPVANRRDPEGLREEVRKGLVALSLSLERERDYQWLIEDSKYKEETRLKHENPHFLIGLGSLVLSPHILAL